MKGVLAAASITCAALACLGELWPEYFHSERHTVSMLSFSILLMLIAQAIDRPKY